MHRRVIDAADVEVDRVPEVDDVARERRRVVVGIAVPQEVPGRVDKCVHRLGLALGGASAGWAGDVHPILCLRKRWAALRLVVLDIGQNHRKLFVRDRHDAARVAVDDRDRAAPVALTREAPVAKPEVDREPTLPLCLQTLDDAPSSFGRRQAVDVSRVDENLVVGVRRVRGALVDVDTDVGGSHNVPNRETKSARELEVSRVVSRHGHDCTGAVVGKHVVGNVHRNALAIDRVDDVETREHAGFLGGRRPLLGLLRRGAPDVLAYLVRIDPSDQLVLGREHEERCAVERVGTRSEDLEILVPLLNAEHDLSPLRATDPVALTGLDRLRPVDRLEVVEERLRVVGDPEKPLLHHARLDEGAAALTGSVGEYLLVGKHGLVVGAPLDGRALAVRKPLFEEPEELPLLPAVVARIVRRELARPVDPPADAAHRRTDRLDVALGDRPRVAPFANCGVLGGQPKRIPPHRMEHLVAVSPPEMRRNVADCVHQHVAQVQGSRRIRQHLEHVALPCVRAFSLGRVGYLPGALIGPDLLPFRLDHLWVVAFHRLRRRRFGVQKSLSRERLRRDRRGVAALSLRHARSRTITLIVPLPPASVDPGSALTSACP